MPYIPEKARQYYNPTLDELVRKLKSVDFPEGDLNYTISVLMREAFEHEPRYATINKLMGVLCSAALEFYRRKAAAYETVKIRDNGDVY